MMGSGAAYAQTAPADDIVILGRGLDLPPGTPAYGTTVIDRDRLTNDASGRVEDVLSDVAGFQQFRRADSRSANPSAQGATLRALGGNASSRTLVLLDGVPIADPFFGYIPFNAIVPDRLAAIRVTRGGGSGPFGAGAVAGTIELVSADRSDLPPIAGEAFYGSRDAQTVSASVSPTLGRGFASLSGRFERGDGFMTTPADQRVAASVPARYRDWSANARAAIPIGGEAELQVRGLAFGDNRTLRFRGADSSSEGEDASIRLVSRGGWQVDALVYLQARNFTNKVISATTFRVTLDQRNTPSTGIGGKIELRPPIGGGHVLRVGGDARLADGELFEDAYSAAGLVTARRNAGGRSTVAGLFVEDDWTIGRLVLTGGARIDRWSITDGFFRERDANGAPTVANAFADRSGTEATGRGGLLLHATRWADLRAAAYTGFRLPTLNELYRPFVVFPITTQANAALSPERLRGIEGGVDLRPATGVQLSLTGFYNRLDDAIANVTLTPTLRRRANVRAIVATGIEASLAWRRGPFSLTASYAYSHSQVRAPGTALDGLAPAQSPRHAASATAAWSPKSGALLSLTARYVGDQYEDDLQTNVLPAATTVDAVARVPVGRRVSVIVRAENLFDAAVVTRNQAGSIDLGTPRTLWVGLRIAG
ncbi:TonB-dependent receptor [Sphingomonas panacisoli]|uniref:TonB-dependent receptor n=2 Tax=Sphingomonas panacisoli TaxID=1813879 RepID=A0A5B8LM45_9SPHN|nr:TonB-dependent receptor [Sphingomonas panacisoli]QDZ09278.1 TonB-dependent receptor [Sphingomonas panacisoli]